MIWGLMLAVSVLLSLGKSMIYDRFAKKVQPGARGIFRFNAACYGIAALAALCMGTGSHVSAVTVGTAIWYALCVFIFQAMSVAAMRSGSMALVTLFGLYGMIIPSLAGPIFWKEPFGIGQAAGMVLMLISVWLISGGKGKLQLSVRWGLMAFLCFLGSGFAGVAEKVHQSTEARGEKTMFLFAAFLAMFILSLAGLLICRRGEKQKAELRKTAVLGGTSGLIVAVFSLVNITLAGNLDSLIYYPVANGGSLLLTVAVSVLFLREKPSGRQLAGFFAGLAAILLLSFPI